MTKPKQAGLYLRISLDRAGKALGVKRQEKDLRALAVALGWGVGRVFIENDTSASKGKKRPVYEEMMRAAEDGIIDGWLVYSVDRLTRRLSELATFLDWRASVGIPFATTEGDNTETANGVMILQIKGALAQQEATRISERVTKAAEQRRESGRPHVGGARMFGFSPDGRTLVPAEAKAIRRGAQLLLAGATYGEVMRLWERLGLETSTGVGWTRESVRSVYGSGRVAGLVTHKGAVVGKAESYPGILTREAWEAVREAAVHGPARPAGYGARKHQLAGFVFCGECGATMVVQATSYVCVKGRQGCGAMRRSKAWVDDFVDGYVRGRLEEARVPVAEQAAESEGEIVELEGRIEQLRAQFTSGAIEGEDFFPLLTGLRAKVGELRREQGEAAKVAARTTRTEPLEVWLHGSLTARRAVLGSVLTGIYIQRIGKIGRRPPPPESITII